MKARVFKSAELDGRELQVDMVFGQPRLLIMESIGGAKGFIFNPDNGAAIAQAVLEAAYATPAPHKVGEAWAALYSYITDEEAREQAELEAEAFQLYCVYMDAREPSLATGSWEMLGESTQRVWLAVARRARGNGDSK